MASDPQEQFPCTLTLHIPFPTSHLSTTALRALQVDKELSPLVQRSFALKSASELQTPPHTSTSTSTSASASASASASVRQTNGAATNGDHASSATTEKPILEVRYQATTNRMLRVAVNGFFESLGVVLAVMEELDVDVVNQPGKESVQGAQGVVVDEGRWGQAVG
ncbi:hypothetical protein LTS18_010488 [Coniosporium uncinatum]|uniref:Uncharacterized protein n=1 Tax=Coniosporium uncinatum TaxID=93489 RepID=A0ACC3CZF4_9PEZI|nr:hypothetical protein LTS18_010488 [Coniosporium uncinatum]